MANKYRIYFFGLVAHIGVDELTKRFSCVIRDPDHEGVLLFGPDDELALKDVETIIIEGLTPRAALVQPTFEKHVPHITKVMGGKIEESPAQGTGRKGTFFHHVGGKLYAALLYEHKAKHFRKKPFQDKELVRDEFVAVLNVLLLDIPEKELVIRAGPLRRRITPDQCVMIANLDQESDDHDPVTDPHIRKYSKITNGSNTGIEIEEYDASSDFEPPFDACDWVVPFIKSKRGVLTSMHSECGNTDYP